MRFLMPTHLLKQAIFVVAHRRSLFVTADAEVQGPLNGPLTMTAAAAAGVIDLASDEEDALFGEEDAEEEEKEEDPEQEASAAESVVEEKRADKGRSGSTHEVGAMFDIVAASATKSGFLPSMPKTKGRKVKVVAQNKVMWQKLFALDPRMSFV